MTKKNSLSEFVLYQCIDSYGIGRAIVCTIEGDIFSEGMAETSFSNAVWVTKKKYVISTTC